MDHCSSTTHAAGIAVHPSGLVFMIIAGGTNHRIQVLHPDLSFSHMFGCGPGQFNIPDDM